MSSKFCCRLCSSDSEVPLFSTGYAFEAHLYKCHMRNSFPLQCDLCPSKFQSHHNLTRHRQRSHSNFDSPPDQCLFLNHCPVCLKPDFRSYDQLRQHLIQSHKPVFKLDKQMTESIKLSKFFPFGAPQTEKDKRRPHLKQRESMKFQCFHKGCDAQYSNRKLFDVHLKDHQIFLSEKCQRCLKPLETNEEFLTSVESQSEYKKCNCKETRPLNCVVENCQKVFKYPCDLKVHVDASHSVDDSRKVTCQYCGSIFSCERNLEDHIRVHFTPHSFLCNCCGQLFSQQTALTRHISTIHKGRKANFCCVCGKSFSQSGNLTLHLKNVHKLQCSKCFGDFKALSKCELEEHVKTCDGNLVYFMEDDNCGIEREIVIDTS